MGSAMRRISIAMGLAIAASSGAGCDDKGGASAVGTAACAEQLAPLREQMQWVDGRRSYSGRLAAVPDWQRAAIPEHILAFAFGEVLLDSKPLTGLPFALHDELSDDIASDEERRVDHERDLERNLQHALKRALAPLGDAPIAVAFEPSMQWHVVAPMLRTLSAQGGAARLLVEMPLPPWFDTRLRQKAGESIGDVASRLAQRSVEVFAECPAAQAALANGAPKMVQYVDAVEACGCRVDVAAARELIHAIAMPGGVGVVELTIVRSGDGAAFTAEPRASWEQVLPRLLATTSPIVLPELPPPREIPLPAPPPPLPGRRRVMR
jgi:hypothetical protein